MEKLIAIGATILLTLIAASGLIFLKLGTKRINKNTLSIINKEIIIGSICYILASIIFIVVVKTQELSFIYPLTAVSYIFVTALSAIILHEEINKYKITAILLIMLGVVVISL